LLAQPIMTFVFPVLVVVITVLARWALQTGEFATSNDNVGSFRVASAQRGRRWLRFEVSHSVVDGTYGYPPLVYWVVSRFSPARWTAIRYWMNFAADGATALLVWGAIRTLLPEAGHEVAFLLAVAVGLNPLLLPLVEHARITAPNARALGLLFNTLWTGLLLHVLATADWRLGIALIPLTWVIVLTSQFGMQVMVGTSGALAILMRTPVPLLVTGSSVLLGWLVPGLGVREVFRHKLAHWRWYIRVQRTIVNVVSLRARPWTDRVEAMGRLLRSPVANGHALGTAFQTSPWWKVIAGLSPVVVLCAGALVSGHALNRLLEPTGSALAMVCLSGFLLFVLTTWPPLVFLGEAERYIEHTLPAFVLCGAWMAAGRPDLLVASSILTVALTLAILFAQLAHRQWPATALALNYPSRGHDEERALLRLLIELGTPIRIASVPVKASFLLHDLLLQDLPEGHERVRFYFQHVLQPGDDRFQYMLDDTTDGYTYLTDDLRALVARYGINIVLVDSAMLYDRTLTAPILEALRARQPMHRGRLVAYSLHDLHQNEADRGTPRPAPIPQQLGAPRPTAREIARQQDREAATDRRPRLLLIADVPDWIFARHARELQERLAARYRIDITYQGQVFDETSFDLIYVMEFNLLPADQIRSPWKYVTGIRSHISWDFLDPEELGRYLDQHYQQTHVVSQRLYTALAPSVANLHVVTHGIDERRFQPVSRAGTPGRLRLGWAGNRRSPAKGFEDFIAPLGTLPGIEIVHCGFVDRNRSADEMPAFYAELDAYVCSSSTEGSNNSVLEAAATGLPIITTDVGTVDEFLRHEVSALIVERTPDAFAEAALRLRDDVALRLRLGEAAATVVQAEWTWAVRAAEYEAFFDHALAHRDAARRHLEPLLTEGTAGEKTSRPAIPLFPHEVDLVALMETLQAAVAGNEFAQAEQTLTKLIRCDPGNPVWPSLLQQLRDGVTSTA